MVCIFSIGQSIDAEKCLEMIVIAVCRSYVWSAFLFYFWPYVIFSALISTGRLHCEYTCTSLYGATYMKIQAKTCYGGAEFKRRHLHEAVS